MVGHPSTIQFQKGNLEVMKVLLELGADVNLQGITVGSSVEYAGKSGRNGYVELFKQSNKTPRS